MVAVNLAPLEPTNREKNERTYIDNLSAHGARLRATYALATWCARRDYSGEWGGYRAR